MINSSLQSEVVYAQLPSPIGKALGFAEICYHFVVALIVAVLGAANPSNISGLIIPVIVDAINKVFAAILGHCRYFFGEGREVMPWLAYLNSPASVIRIEWALGPMTSLHHVVM